MKQNITDLPNRSKLTKRTVCRDKNDRAAKYNYSIMKDDTVFAEQSFGQRLAMLRSGRGISAREMSLSMGQGAGYVNNIENGRNLPSMAMFFEICEYLDVTPAAFFAYTDPEDGGLSELLAGLSPKDRRLLIEIAEKFRR